MKTLLSLAVVAVAPFAAPSGDPSLAVRLVPGAVEFTVEGASTPYVAGVLVSLSPDLVHYFVGLPPLLRDFVVAGTGYVELGSYELTLPDVALPPGVMIHAQGVTFDGVGLASSSVAAFVLDATGNGGTLDPIGGAAQAETMRLLWPLRFE